MAEKLTLDDVLNKSPEQILEAIRKREGEPLLTQPKQELSNEETTEKPEQQNKQTPVKVDVNFRKMLKGTFLADDDFAKGQLYMRDGYDFIVIGVENSSKRIRFNISRSTQVSEEKIIQDTFGTLSLSRETLTGSREPFPYKKGDNVILLENPEVKYPVVGINPASRNVVLNIFGKLRYVKISKVKLADEVYLEDHDEPLAS
jgi:hypothetical protein